VLATLTQAGCYSLGPDV